MSEAQEALVHACKNLVVRFPVRTRGGRTYITPVDQVGFEIHKGEVLSLVGESGSGKTTIGRALLGLVQASSGKIVVNQRDVTNVRGRELKRHRQHVQMVFQDPFGSLNPVRTVRQHLQFPVRRHAQGEGSVDEQIEALLERVGLTPVAEMQSKFPHELSGGQRQRLAIARALSVNPRFLVADEPISMLDVSIRAGILRLLNQLKHDFDLAFLYITHDLASARYFGDRIMVMYGGRVMEVADSAELVRNPKNPYTKLLLAATPGSNSKGDCLK